MAVAKVTRNSSSAGTAKMSAVESHVFDPEALKLIGRAIGMAEVMLPPSCRGEQVRREVALAILKAVEVGETDAETLAEIDRVQLLSLLNG